MPVVYSLNYKGKPIYIGVGHDPHRPYEHLDIVDHPTKRLLDRRAINDTSLYDFIAKVGTSNISVKYILKTEDMDACYKLEEKLHRHYGLRCDHNGPLFGLRYGRKYSNYTKEHKYLGDKNPFYGKHHTERAKEVISKKTSERLKGGHLNKEWRHSLSVTKSGKNHPMYGKHQSKEARRKIGEGIKNNPIYVKKLRNLHSVRTRYKNQGKEVPDNIAKKIAYWENIKKESESNN